MESLVPSFVSVIPALCGHNVDFTLSVHTLGGEPNPLVIQGRLSTVDGALASECLLIVCAHTAFDSVCSSHPHQLQHNPDPLP